MSVPDISSLTSAPLRNRVRVQLAAPVPEVWALLGDLRKLPQYSAGLERVEVQSDARGRCIGYVCHFKPLEPRGERMVSREVVRWWEADVGYASSSAPGDAFGIANDLNLVLLERSGDGTIVTWTEHFEAQDNEAMKRHFDEALADIADHLASRFGGRLVERYVQP
jgi:carbon monoxide dehydrogenase subunit G